MNIFHFLHLRETQYIHLVPRQCQGCWECVQVCSEAVLEKLDRTRHPHVHVSNPDACTGCKKCVRACAYAAIVYTYVRKSSLAPRQHLQGKEYGK